MDLKHPNIVNTYVILEGNPRALKRVMVIETDLPVDGRHKNYDQKKMDQIISMAADFLPQNNKVADTVSIRTVKRT